MNERTKREMAAGATISARHAAQRLVGNSPPRVNARSTITKPAGGHPWSYRAEYRPADYIPSQFKGQGYIEIK
jgi:hypothetical protein